MKTGIKDKVEFDFSSEGDLLVLYEMMSLQKMVRDMQKISRHPSTLWNRYTA